MINFKIIFFSLCFLLIIGCENNGNSDLILKNLDEIYIANPYEDFEKAIKRKDFRFKGLSLGTLIVPFISDCLKNEFGVVVIKGTTHSPESYEHVKLNAIATAYAETYNINMLSFLAENNLSKCEKNDFKTYHEIRETKSTSVNNLDLLNN